MKKPFKVLVLLERCSRLKKRCNRVFQFKSLTLGNSFSRSALSMEVFTNPLKKDSSVDRKTQEGRVMKIGIMTLLVLISGITRADLRRINIYLDSKLAHLENQKCFKTWSEDLKKKYDVKLYELNPKQFSVSILKEHYKSRKAHGIIAIGDFNFPKIKYKLKDPQADSSTYNRITQSMLPFMNLNQDFPDGGISLGKGNFYQSMTNWVGIINYSASASVQEYCDYFSRVMNHKRCLPSKSYTAAGFIDRPWRSGQFYESFLSFQKTSSSNYLSFKFEDFLKKLSQEPVDIASMVIHSEKDHHFPEYGESIGLKDILSVHPKASFFNLSACDSAQTNGKKKNLAQTYLSLNSTLGVLAPSNSGGMRHFDLFFEDFAKPGEAMGDILLQYFSYLLDMESIEDQELAYNMLRFALSWDGQLMYFGDPTVSLKNCQAH